jgi:polysaccharide pyruvyl transferase WcaK-like protein
MYGCGIGHVRRRFNRWLSRRVLDKNVDIITLRDAISRAELTDMGITRPDVRAAADPALSLPPAPEADADAFLRAQGVDSDGAYLCVSVRAWKTFDNFAAFAAAADYAHARYGLKTLLLPIESPKDVAPSRAVAAAMGHSAMVLDAPDRAELTIALMRKMRLVCAMRLHALVFALAAGTPAIAAAYDVKVSSFMAYIGSDACAPLDALTADWLCARIDAAMAARGLPGPVAQRLQTLERQNARAAAQMLGLPEPQ